MVFLKRHAQEIVGVSAIAAMCLFVVYIQPMLAEAKANNSDPQQQIVVIISGSETFDGKWTLQNIVPETHWRLHQDDIHLDLQVLPNLSETKPTTCELHVLMRNVNKEDGNFILQAHADLSSTTGLPPLSVEDWRISRTNNLPSDTTITFP